MDVGAAKIAEYDNVFYVSAGEDESSTWQEFGEMKFMTQNDVTDAFGPKALGDLTQTNWAITRYVPWTSWVSAATNWPNASGNTSVEGESSGMSTYAHELSHNLSIPDNYGNPYAVIQQRGFTGMWDMMSRGTFNGPGGPHTRFQIPATKGASLGSQHNMRNKRFLNFVTDADLVRLNRNGLAASGLAVADVTAREVPHTTGEVAGVRVELDGADTDKSTPCTLPDRLEVRRRAPQRHGGHRQVQRLHDGSRAADRVGLLRPGPRRDHQQGQELGAPSCGGSSCFAWMIDSHPDDINHVDFVKPDGTPKIATQGDERQLNDGSFNAGWTRALPPTSGLRSAEPPALLRGRQDHRRAGHPALQGRRQVARRLRPADARRGALGRGRRAGRGGQWSTCTFGLKNTGAAAATDPALHPQDETLVPDSDLYRLRLRPRAPAGAPRSSTRSPP